jgi:hypothetical protein
MSGRRRVLTIAAVLAVLTLALVIATSRRTPAPRTVERALEPTADSQLAATPSAEPETLAVASAGPVQPAPSAQAHELDEDELMRLLRSARDNDPTLAVELAREGNRRFPKSPEAPERTSILIHALAAQGLASEARGEAEDMVNRYPDSNWVREVELFTGAHRHRNLRLDGQGRLTYVDPPPS